VGQCTKARYQGIGDMPALAAMHKGKCLSRTYLGTYQRIGWQCALGHRWEATPNSIRRGDMVSKVLA